MPVEHDGIIQFYMQVKSFETILISDMRRLTKTVDDLYGFDFSNYALSSLSRRVQRVLDLFKLGSMDHLISRLESDQEFFHKFLMEITVNTTEMFRDPEMWNYLREKVLPKLSHRETIRVWHAACSSGEEVYSMAILLEEEGLLDRSRLFASDIDRNVLGVAKKGLYKSTKMPQNLKNYQTFEGRKRLTNYYQPREKDREIQMDPNLMRNTFFTVHDLVKGQPFGKFDLVLLRNILIYFNKQLQNEVMKLIHENMTLGGYLVLGSKETIRWNECAHKYLEVSGEERIYKKIKE